MKVNKTHQEHYHIDQELVYHYPQLPTGDCLDYVMIWILELSFHYNIWRKPLTKETLFIKEGKFSKMLNCAEAHVKKPKLLRAWECIQMLKFCKRGRTYIFLSLLRRMQTWWLWLICDFLLPWLLLSPIPSVSSLWSQSPLPLSQHVRDLTMPFQIAT